MLAVLPTETTTHNPKIYACSLWTYYHKKRRCWQPEPRRGRLGANYASRWRCRGGNTHPCSRFWAPLLLQPASVFPFEGRGRHAQSQRFHLPGKPSRRRSDPACHCCCAPAASFPASAPEPAERQRRRNAQGPPTQFETRIRMGGRWTAAPGKAPLLNCSPDALDGSSHHPLPAPLGGAVEVDLQHGSRTLFMELGGLPGSSVRDGRPCQSPGVLAMQTPPRSQIGRFSSAAPRLGDLGYRRKLLVCPLIRGCLHWM